VATGKGSTRRLEISQTGFAAKLSTVVQVAHCELIRLATHPTLLYPEYDQEKVLAIYEAFKIIQLVLETLPL
jgi:hypothetical protein